MHLQIQYIYIYICLAHVSNKLAGRTARLHEKTANIASCGDLFLCIIIITAFNGKQKAPKIIFRQQQEQQQEQEQIQIQQSIKIKSMTTKSICCRGCAGEHFTIRCPLRSPGDRSTKRWQDTVEAFEANERAKPFRCLVPMHLGNFFTARGHTVDELWCDVRVSHQHSLYLDFTGIQNKDANNEQLILPLDDPNVEPGHYKFIGRTVGLINPDLYGFLDDARHALRGHRPLDLESVRKVHDEVLLLFNHFSLCHEGNDLSMDETEVIRRLLARKDQKRGAEEEEANEATAEITAVVNGTDRDIQEAINHINISNQLQELAKHDITETTILNIHALVMDKLLKNPDEGLPGEYRKVPIIVHGDDRQRAQPADIPPLMSWFSESLDGPGEDEHIIDYLSRIHSVFQEIHPFLDGNGRTGRLLMNLFLLKNGYPVLTFPRTLSFMFNQGVHNGIRGNHAIFSRLLAESLFKSFQAYETALGVELIPTIQELSGDRVAQTNTVTP